MTPGPYWTACRWSRWPNLSLAFWVARSPAQKSSCSARGDARCSGHGPSLTPGNPRRPPCASGSCRLELPALFRALERVNLSPNEIPQRLLRQLFELDADLAEALWALDQPEGSLDRRAMLRDTLAALDQLPSKSAQFRGKLPARTHPTLEPLEGSVRKALNPKEAYNMVPGRDPENA